MEDGERKFDLAEVAWAVEQRAATCLAQPGTLRGTHAQIFWPSWEGRDSVVAVQLVVVDADCGAAVNILPTQKAELDRLTNRNGERIRKHREQRIL